MTVPITPSAPIGLADQMKPEPAHLAPGGAGPVLVANPASATQGAANLLPSNVTQAFTRFGAQVERMNASSAANLPAHAVSGNAHFEIDSSMSDFTAVKPAADPSNMKPQMALMLQTFDLSINTELVSRAVTEFTGSVNTLVKTQ